jgi:hypothetical protein
MRQTLVRQKLAEEFPVPSDSKIIRLVMSAPAQMKTRRNIFAVFGNRLRMKKVSLAGHGNWRRGKCSLITIMDISPTVAIYVLSNLMIILPRCEMKLAARLYLIS